MFWWWRTVSRVYAPVYNLVDVALKWLYLDSPPAKDTEDNADDTEDSRNHLKNSLSHNSASNQDISPSQRNSLKITLPARLLYKNKLPLSVITNTFKQLPIGPFFLSSYLALPAQAKVLVDNHHKVHCVLSVPSDLQDHKTLLPQVNTRT